MPDNKRPKTGDDGKPQPPSVRRVPAENFMAVYANTTQVRMGIFDVQFSFGVNVENEDKDSSETTMRESVQVSMSPQHAKAVLQLLAGNLKGYEEEFGVINLKGKSHSKEESTERKEA